MSEMSASPRAGLTNIIPFRNTPIAWLHKLIWIYIPNVVLRIDQTLTAGRVTGSLAWLYRRLMYDRHPTIVVRC